MKKIPFNKPTFTGNELEYIKQAVLSGKISGDGIYKFYFFSLNLLIRINGVDKLEVEFVR